MNAAADQTEFFKTLAQKSGGKLRGDYDRCDAQYVIAQDWSAYTPAQHALWRRLYQRQSALLPGRACDAFMTSLQKMSASEAIPCFEHTSEALHKATAWQLVAVPGLIPDLTFFEHLASRRFPVTVWLREPEEFDYIVEPDVFHDFFGHVPLLFDPVFADHLQQYGLGGLKAMRLDSLNLIARLYWYTVEFGLMQSHQGLRAYGAGILSSGDEIRHCLNSIEPKRLAFDPARVMRTQYRIDSYQQTYFVVRDFQELFDKTEPDFTPIYARLKMQEALPAGVLLEGEEVIAPNTE